VPDGNEAVIMLTGPEGAAATLRVSDVLALCAGEAESITLTVNEKFPFCVGVPEMIPALENISAGASDPETRLHAYAGVPPLAAKVTLYLWPRVAETSEAVLICKGAGSTTRLKVLIATCCGDEESAARIPTGKLPLWAGVPEIMPVPDRVNPDGSDPEFRLQMY
jgi:hypothetical protein